ncbi:hypothetical protein MMC28_005672 [Mycoblastus sanguinarius]|nr:hypothetical protein [Mycoblastus sanguinarius]
MGEKEPISIEPARTADDLESAAYLFAAYAKSLGFDLAFQDFDTELKSLPGKYAPPKGDVLLARAINGVAVGCVAIRPMAAEGCCEIKRLYILPEGRGMGLGKKLVNAIVEIASRQGYQDIKLDTLPSMIEALTLYKSAGFVEIAPYYQTPLTGTIFLARRAHRGNELPSRGFGLDAKEW